MNPRKGAHYGHDQLKITAPNKTKENQEGGRSQLETWLTGQWKTREDQVSSGCQLEDSRSRNEYMNLLLSLKLSLQSATLNSLLQLLFSVSLYNFHLLSTTSLSQAIPQTLSATYFLLSNIGGRRFLSSTQQSEEQGLPKLMYLHHLSRLVNSSATHYLSLKLWTDLSINRRA